MKIKNNPRY